MNIHRIIHKIKGESPIILSGVAIAGVVTTAYLASKATIRAKEELEYYKSLNEAVYYVESNRRQQLQKDVKQCWRFYIPTAASGVVTIGCIVGSTRISNRRMAAAQAALVISDRVYQEYRAKIVEELGAKKEEEIRAKIVEDRVRKTPPAEVVVAGGGDVLCCELYTGRYFKSDIETLRKSVNKLNAKMLHHDEVTLEDWYDLIGLQPTSFSCDMGWRSDRLLELEFTTVLTEDERPCLAFEYNYLKPIYEGLFRE